MRSVIKRRGQVRLAATGNCTASGNKDISLSSGLFLVVVKNNGLAVVTVWGGSTLVQSISKGDGNVFTFSAKHPGFRIASTSTATNLTYTVYQLV